MNESEMKVVGHKLDKVLHSKLKQIAAKQNKTMQDIYNELILKFVEVYGENPQHTIESFQDENFKARPSFDSSRDSWVEYINKLTEDQAKEVEWQAQTIESLAQKKINYGNPLAIVH